MKFNTQKKKINKSVSFVTPHTPWRLYWILEEKKNWIRFFGTCARKQKKGLTRARSKKKKYFQLVLHLWNFFAEFQLDQNSPFFSDSNKSYTCDEDRCNPCIVQQKMQQPVYVPPFYSFLFLGSKKRWTGYRQPLQETADGVKSGSGFFFSTEKEK